MLRFPYGVTKLLSLTLVLLFFKVDSLRGTNELAYYRAASTSYTVFLEWVTVREVNLSGFEILSKRVRDADVAYAPLGSRIAMGSAMRGATYTFSITSGLILGERYCFRLREIPSDETSGEAHDLCGYGLLRPIFLPIAYK